MILLPQTAPARAKRVLDRLRRGLGRERIPVGARRTVRISASFGVALLDPEQPVMVSIDRADRAMYEAKTEGRNRVVIWVSDPPATAVEPTGAPPPGRRS